MLENFRKSKQKEILSLQKLEREGKFLTPFMGKRASLKNELQNNSFGIIAEYKRASPSKGSIREDLDVEEVTRQYSEGGALALSVLTEEDWFKGSFSFLDRAALINPNIPIMRKDFIFDPVQIKYTATSRAAAILLIVRAIVNVDELRLLQDTASQYNLDCVVEVFDQNDLSKARASGAKIIQVNARDLDKLEVNKAACIDLAKTHPPLNDEIWIAASGMENPEDLLNARDAGFRAALIGSSLMAARNPGSKLAALLESIK